MEHLNQRREPKPEALSRRISILAAFPDERLETIIVQWEHCRPSLFIQLKYSPYEPLQFPKKRPNVPGNSELPEDLPLEVDGVLRNFVDPLTGGLFESEGYNADLVLSQNAFSTLQPEPDLVLPEEPLWECRREALDATGIKDEPGIARNTG